MLRKLRITLIAVLALFFYSIFLASSVRNVYLANDGGKGRLGFLVQPLKILAEVPSSIKTLLGAPEFYVRNKKESDGFTYFRKKSGTSYPKLLLTYKVKPFNQLFDLVDLNDGSLIKQWSPDDKELFRMAYNEQNPKKPAPGSDLYFMHPYMTKDSSLIFSAQLTSLLAKIDKDGKLLWLKNDQIYHHTLESDGMGHIYSCTQPFESGKYDCLPGDYSHYKNILQDDHITMLDEVTGEQSYTKSVIQILLDNGFEKLLLAKGQVISDPIHLNDIQPALSDSDYWKKNDLLISCRNLSTVFLYRPSTNKIIWLKSGPWFNQHDVDFVSDHQISIFGNNIIREESANDPKLTSENLSFSNKRAHNEVYLYDFANDSVSRPYHRMMEEEHIRTSTSGRSEILKNGDVFIEETANGRIFVGDSIGKKIEFVKRLDADHISTLFWSRIIN